MGILADLMREKFGIETRSQVSPVAAVGVASIPVLPNHPDRVGFVMLNLSVNLIYISPVSPVAVPVGILLPALGGGIAFSWDEDFELCSSAWYGIATVAGSAVYILEIIGEKAVL